MKHLFNDISQDEKDRILEMHKGAINSEMINEQPARFIGQGLRKGAQYAGQFLDDTGRALGDVSRYVGRKLNPQKVRILHIGGFNPPPNMHYNEQIGRLLRKNGTIQNNQFVQSELGVFNHELYGINKINQQFLKLEDSQYTGLRATLKHINDRLKTPIGKALDLGFIYQELLMVKQYMAKSDPAAQKSILDTIESFETAVTNILSQAGR